MDACASTRHALFAAGRRENFCTVRKCPCNTILAMFDLIDPKPRGFSGRPLIALLFAAGLGAAAYPLGLRLHLNDDTVFVILATVTFVLGYAWEHLDARRG